MTDHIPADKVRAWVNSWETTHPEHRTLEDAEGIIQALRALLPPPPLPTLADMTPEARRDCQWMQADTKPWGRVVIIVPDLSDGRAALLDIWGDVAYEDHARITPRPDLPRLEWPGTEKPAPAPTLPGGWRLADHKDNGRVIVTTITPDDDGDVYFAFPVDDLTGYDWDACRPDELTYIDADQGGDTSDTVPESTLSVGSVWKNANALTRACSESGRDQIAVIDKNGDVGVWDAELRGWRAYAPGPVFAPFTILHAGKKADQ